MFIAGALAAGLVSQQHQHPPAAPPKPPTTQQPPAHQPATPPAHDHAAMAPGAWHFMQDGVAYLTFNRQGGDRGDKEVVSQNWWMGMASRTAGGGELTAAL